MIDDNSGIAYGVSLAVTAIIILGIVWITMAPVVDEFDSLTTDLNTRDSGIFTDRLVDKMNECNQIWSYIVFLFVAVPFVFAIIRAIKRQAYND